MYLSAPHVLKRSKQKTCDAGDTSLTAIKKSFQRMTWNTELLLIKGGPWAQSSDEARNNLSAAWDQFFLCPQWSNSLIKAQFHGKAKPLGPKDSGLYIWLPQWEARQKRAIALFCGTICLQSETGKGKDGRVITSCFATNLLEGAWYNDQQMQLHYPSKE